MSEVTRDTRRGFADAARLMGNALGLALSPLAMAASLGRRARVFHPRGTVYRARMRPAVSGGPVGELARRIAGPALVRLSGAIWKEREWIDVLGVAIRLRATETIESEPDADDQDLLLASFCHSWTLPIALWQTRTHDFLANEYHAVLPFRAPSFRRLELRLRPEPRLRPVEDAANREERLAHDVSAGRARFILEVRARRGEPRAWTALATLELLAPVAMDQESLRFSPFQNGRGIEPVGFLQALRRATYPASQLGRSLASPERRTRLREWARALAPQVQPQRGRRKHESQQHRRK